MTLARALRLVLAVALLAAWQGALVHPLEHLDEHGGFVHVAGVCGSHESGGSDEGNALCDALAAVTACVASSFPPAAAPADEVLKVAFVLPSVLRGVPPPAYRSQAPPQVS